MIPEFKVWIKEYNCFADCIEAIGYDTSEIDLCWGIEESGTFGFDEVVGNIYENKNMIGYGDNNE